MASRFRDETEKEDGHADRGSGPRKSIRKTTGASVGEFHDLVEGSIVRGTYEL